MREMLTGMPASAGHTGPAEPPSSPQSIESSWCGGAEPGADALAVGEPAAGDTAALAGAVAGAPAATPGAGAQRALSSGWCGEAAAVSDSGGGGSGDSRRSAGSGVWVLHQLPPQVVRYGFPYADRDLRWSEALAAGEGG